MVATSNTDIDLHHEARGDGAPLVLIPGLAAGGWIWFKQIDALSEYFRVITFDPRGIGVTPFTSEQLTITLLANDVAALLRKLGIDRAHILGASFGGFVAQEFAAIHPEMTRSLVLSCTSFGGPNHVPASSDTIAAIASTNGFNTEDRIRRILLPAFSPEFVREHPEELEQTMKLRLSTFVSEETYRAQVAAAINFNAEAKLATFKAPTLILSGDSDAIVPVQNSHNLVSRISDAELAIVEGGSHLFFIERPKEFNRLVIDFLRRH